LSHGNVVARKAALDIIEYTLAKTDPYEATEALTDLDRDLLRIRIGTLEFDLSTYKRIFLVGAGKASFRLLRLWKKS